MADVFISHYKDHGQLAAGYKGFVRILDKVIDLGKDVTMGSATDVIKVAKLPGSAVVIAASVQQVVAGTGAGTLTAQVGSATISEALLATAPVGTTAGVTASTIPMVVPVAGADLQLVGAEAVRDAGKVRVIAVLVEGDREPREPGIVNRDAIGG